MNGRVEAGVVGAEAFRLTIRARLDRRRVLAVAVAHIIPGGARTDGGVFLGGEAPGFAVQDRGQDQASENEGGGKRDAELFHTAISSPVRVDVRAPRDKPITNTEELRVFADEFLDFRVDEPVPAGNFKPEIFGERFQLLRSLAGATAARPNRPAESFLP